MPGPALINNRMIPRAQPADALGAGPWDTPLAVVHLDVAGNTVAVGASVMAGTEKLRVVGAVLLDDAASNLAFLELKDGDSAAISAADSGRLRYNDAAGQFEISEAGGAYAAIATIGASGWTDDGAIVRLTTAADSVSVGSAALSGTEKFRITGGAVLIDGTTGATPVSGAGTRLMWGPAKAALRAGVVSGTQWNDASVGTSSAAFNEDTTASGTNSTAFGDTTEALGAHSVSQGESAQAARIGQQTLSNGQFAAVGDAQTSLLVLRRQTSDATPTELTLDGAAPAGTAVSTSNRFILEDDTSYILEIHVMASDTGAADQAAWILQSLYTRATGAASVAIVDGEIKTKIAESGGAGSWDVDTAADTTNGSVQVEVTGEGGKTLNWVASVKFTEVLV